MKTQELKLRTNVPIVIETPEGFIRIRPGAKRRSILIELPTDSLCAYVGEERAIKEARFMESDEHGELRPKFDLLVAEKDEAGALIGLVERPLARIKRNGQRARIAAATQGES